METRKAKTTVVVGLSAMVVLLVLCLPAAAGNLEPNAPPGPTMKTLDEVEPRIPIQSLSGDSAAEYKITQPGSYYLTGDVNVTSTAKHGIQVYVNDVTIDLMGYTLKGPGSGTDGIYMNGRANVEIRNGTVRNFDRGIVEYSSSGKNHRVIDVRAVSNQSHGMLLYGNGHLVKDCTAADNSNGYGIYLYYSGSGGGCTVTGNTAYNNGYSGIFANSYGCTVTGNTAYNNGNNGISAAAGNTVTGNTAYNNGNIGIYAGTGNTVIGNTTYANQNYGISLSGNNLVDQNTAYNNGTNMNTCGSCTFGTNHAPP